MDVRTKLSIKMAEDNYEEDTLVIIDKESDFVAVVTTPTAIWGTGLFVRRATFGYITDKTFEPDWDGTMIYDQKDNADDYLYYEQDDVNISLHNYMNSINTAISLEKEKVAI